MDPKFEEIFDHKFGVSFMTESMKFLHKAIMHEGWLMHKEFMNKIIDEVDSETNKGE